MSLKTTNEIQKNQNTKKLTSVLVSGEVREALCRGGEPIKESWEKWFLVEINKQYLIKTGTQATSESERKFYWKLAFFLKKMWRKSKNSKWNWEPSCSFLHRLSSMSAMNHVYKSKLPQTRSNLVFPTLSDMSSKTYFDNDFFLYKL